MPTDTIYGLVAVYSKETIERVHRIKKRSFAKPFLVLVPDKFSISNFIDQTRFTKEMQVELKRGWPGRNSYVLPKRSDLEYPEGGKIVLRRVSYKSNPFFYSVVNLLNKPLVAPSLNFTDEKPESDLSRIQIKFEPLVDAIFYDLDFVPGEPSSLWDLTVSPFVKIR